MDVPVDCCLLKIVAPRFEPPFEDAARRTVEWLNIKKVGAPHAEKPPRITGPASPRGYAEIAAVQPAKPKSLKVQEDREGIIKVERKEKKLSCQNKCGTAPNKDHLLLCAEVATTQLYVSRVHFAFMAKDIVEYLHAKAGLNMRVERLESRRGVNFNSFVVRMPTEHMSTYMKEEFWPQGVVFRRFPIRNPYVGVSEV